MNKSIKIVLILFLSILNINCSNNNQKNSQENGRSITILSPIEFKEKSLNQTIIDIRTPGEYRSGYIKGAKNINLFSKSFLDEIAKFDKNEPIYIYCRSGNRTSSASKKISNLGFKQVYDLNGGIKNWTGSNNEIVK
jgi:phage shock protein E